MARTGTIVAIIAIVILIIVGGALGYTFLVQNQIATPNNSSSISTLTSTTISSTTSHITSSSTTIPIAPNTTTTSIVTTNSSKTTSTTTNSTASVSSSKNLTYALQLLPGSLGPVLSSPLTTTSGKTFLPNDNATVPFVDNSNNWTITGDFEPSRAWFTANSSGLTLTQQTQNAPHIEWDGQHEENVSELSGVLYSVPLNSTIYSIQVSLPNYSSIFANCVYDNSDTGCSYQGQGPEVSANWAIGVIGSGFDNSIAVSIAEGKSGSLTTGASTASVVNGTYVGGKYLGGFSEPNFTSSHVLTIATDRKSFIELFVDNRLVYSNSTLPINLTGTQVGLNFYQFVSVNNQTISTTWSNVNLYPSNQIIVGNLTSGMSVIASGPNGYNATVPANSSGFAVIDASSAPTGITIRVVLNGSAIATYPQPVNVGSHLELNVTSTG